MNRADNMWVITDDFGDYIPLKRIDIAGHIKDHAASYTISQTFKNTGDKCCEAIYTFPVGWSCVVTRFEAIINGEHLVAQTLSKKKAEKKYLNAADHGDLPIMLETSQEGIATVSLGNLKQNDEVTLKISLFTMLLPENGAIRLTLPLNTGERYSSNGKQGKLQEYEQVTTDFYAEYEATAKFFIEGVLASTSISVPSHDYDIEVQDECLVVTVDEAYADRNLVLAFDDVGALNRGYTVADPFKKNNYLTLLASTVKGSSHAQKPLALHILVDLSGSMGGVGIQKLREGLASLTEILGENDAVTLTGFGSTVDDRIPDLMSFNREFVSSTFIPVIDKLFASLGGTELQQALNFVVNKAEASAAKEKFQAVAPRAISAHRREMPGKYRHAILLITDGEVWLNELDVITRTLSSKRIPVFCIGVGNCAVANILKNIAAASHASCEMVTHAEDMGAAVSRLIKSARSEVVKIAALSYDRSGKEKDGRSKAESRIYWVKQPQYCYSNITAATFMASHCLPNRLNPELIAENEDGDKYNLAKVIFESIKDEDLARDLARYIAYQKFAEDDDASLAKRYGLLTTLTSMILVKERAQNDKDYGTQTINVPQMADPGRLQSGMNIDYEVEDGVRICNSCRAPASNIKYLLIPRARQSLSSLADEDDYAGDEETELKAILEGRVDEILDNDDADLDDRDADDSHEEHLWSDSLEIDMDTFSYHFFELEEPENALLDSFISDLRKSADFKIFKDIVLAVLKETESTTNQSARIDTMDVWNVLLTRLKSNVAFNTWLLLKSFGRLTIGNPSHRDPAVILMSVVLFTINAEHKLFAPDSKDLPIPEPLFNCANNMLLDNRFNCVQFKDKGVLF